MFALAIHFLSNTNPYSTTVSFPFCRTPELVQEEILANFSLSELFLFSTISKRSNKLVRNSHYWKKLKVMIAVRKEDLYFMIYLKFFQPILRISIYQSPKLNNINESLKFDEHHVKYQLNEETQWINTYWNDVTLGMRIIGDRLLYFNPKSDISMYLCGPELIISVEPVIEWLKIQRIEKLKHLSIEGSWKGPIGFQRILKNFQVTKSLSTKLFIDFSEIQIPTNLKKLNLDNCRNLKMDEFSIINPEITYLSGSGFTSEDLNRFLKAWMNGEVNSRLKYFSCTPVVKIDRRKVLEGIEGVEQPRELRRSYRLNDLDVITFAGGFDIRRRHDGVIATIFCGQVFRMIVWTL